MIDRPAILDSVTDVQRREHLRLATARAMDARSTLNRIGVLNLPAAAAADYARAAADLDGAIAHLERVARSMDPLLADPLVRKADEDRTEGQS